MYRVLAWIIAAPLYLLSLLPLRVHYFFSDIIRFLLQRVLKYRRKVIDINIKAALPEADAAARFLHAVEKLAVILLLGGDQAEAGF